jgi:iron complex transport system permease protein
MKLRHLFVAALVTVPLLLAVGLLTGSAGFGCPDLSTTTGRALLDLRLCRLLTGFVVGAALAVSGCALQAVLRNALAEPYVLGISGGGSLGAALMLATGLASLTPLALPAGAFVAAILTLLVICLIARRAGGFAPHTLILTGVVAGTMLSSLLLLVLSFARLRVVHSVTWWMMGNLSGATWPLLFTVIGLVSLACLLLQAEARAMNALLLGHEAASNLGIRTQHVIPLILTAATLAAAAAVSISGIIGFVGLIIPHVARRIVGVDHRRLLPVSAIGGGTFLVLCDALARLLFAPHEIPVGVVTALLGGPFFLIVLTQKKPHDPA